LTFGHEYGILMFLEHVDKLGGFLWYDFFS